MNAAAILGMAGAGVLVVTRAATAAQDDDRPAEGFPVTYSNQIRRFADAIAYAEGFYAAGNPIPRRLNNPGDLKASAVPSIGKDASGHLEFATIADGWEALHRQLWLIVVGKSRVYTLDMTLEQMGAKYAEGPTWASNVAQRLGCGRTATLRSLLTEG
ncbi:MAG: hypothetical protein A3E78_04280 [Alphaproteobacteria bacterium RIFCSPHIGHO2_12_FULL_63_12]|nr:MAG: hypothetical protein A3E78_04280 [Alphaproteobacteria bacterium RIFCSPHIGHO2_12_FULL_63_12]